MKNWKVSVKLIVSFMVVAFMTAAVGIFGIFGMSSISKAMDNMYVNQTVPMPEMTNTVEMLQRMRACMREIILGASLDDKELIEDAYSRVKEYEPQMRASMDAYYATISDTTELGKKSKDLFYEARDLFDQRFMVCMEKMYEQALDGASAAEMYDYMGTYTADTNKIVDNFDQCLQMKIQSAETANKEGADTARNFTVINVVVLVAALGVAIFFALFVSNLISKPLKILCGYLNDAGLRGVLDMTPEEKKWIPVYSAYKDEVGEAMRSASAFMDHITTVSRELESIADGDLSFEVKVLSNEDTIGKALQVTLQNLNSMFSEIKTASEQVTMGSSQIADGAQSLASGSTEQAATLQEISASISDISEKTRENANRTNNASNLANTIMKNAEKGSKQMEQMISAVDEINHANQNISKVIKAIDDIAFQTNILALNAAVEAARAGAAGKGFAVVAEEVRNLAAKSAESAKDTGVLIANSMDKAQLGTQIAGETAASLSEIVSGIGESNRIIAEIASSSEEQTGAISQINSAIGGVTQVVQQNSATAEESAAASEEMSGQAGVLESLISKFKLKR